MDAALDTLNAHRVADFLAEETAAWGRQRETVAWGMGSQGRGEVLAEGAVVGRATLDNRIGTAEGAKGVRETAAQGGLRGSALQPGRANAHGHASSQYFVVSHKPAVFERAGEGWVLLECLPCLLGPRLHGRGYGD